MDDAVGRRKLPGVEYVLVDAGSTIFSYRGGFRDLRRRLPVTPETTFMASSSTKAVTAIAVIQLVEQGLVDLEDPLSRHYDAHPYGSGVTIRQMLNHSSGIPNPLPVRWLHPANTHASFDEVAALEQALAKNARLKFEPGSRYSYSNLAYWLLGKVVESVSGKPYCEYVETHVAGRVKADFGCTIPDESNHARGFMSRRSLTNVTMFLMMDRQLLAGTVEGEWELAPVYMNGAAYGGIIGTAVGFGALVQDLLKPSPSLISAAAREWLLAEQRTADGSLLPATLGWHAGNLAGRKYYGKPGGGPGFQSNVRIYPDVGIGSAWLANETCVTEGPINALADTFDRSFFGA